MAPAILQSIPNPLSLAAAANYDLTVAPYWAALQAYPAALWETLQAKAPLHALITFYTTTNPLLSGAAFAVATIPIFFVVSEANRNYSQVDRCWSILPVIFNAQYALWRRLASPGVPAVSRVDAIAALTFIWGTRLTFNYWRRGGYKIGSEDYRWALIEKQIGRVGFTLLNVVFIASIQPILLMFISLPTYILLLAERVTGPALTPVDLGFIAWILFLIGFEFVADQQQWNFHQAKHEYQKAAKAQPGWRSDDLNLGFNTTGLWRYSRHPNFAAEQAVWVSIYAWSCAITKTPYNWSGIGAICYLFLFQASTPLTEWISSEKYSEYKNYQKNVGMFIPLPGQGWSPIESAQRAVKNAKKRQ